MELWNILVCLSTLYFCQSGLGLSLKADPESLRIYYDSAGAPVPMLTDSSMVAPTLKTPLVRFGPLPCSCADLRCGCCVNMRINLFNFERQACTNFTYDPNRFAVEMNMLWNQQSVYNRSISGMNPPPLCVPVPIPPYLPSVDQCVRMFNIHTPGYNMHMCMNMETRIQRVPVLVLEFDCFQMGWDGAMLLKPPQAGANQTAEAAPVDEEAAAEVEEAENVLDPVDEDKKKVNQTSSINGTSIEANSTNTEIETQIGEGSPEVATPEYLTNQTSAESELENSASGEMSNSVEAVTVNLIEDSLVASNHSLDETLTTTEATNESNNSPDLA